MAGYPANRNRNRISDTSLPEIVQRAFDLPASVLHGVLNGCDVVQQQLLGMFCLGLRGGSTKIGDSSSYPLNLVFDRCIRSCSYRKTGNSVFGESKRRSAHWTRRLVAWLRVPIVQLKASETERVIARQQSRIAELDPTYRTFVRRHLRVSTFTLLQTQASSDRECPICLQRHHVK